MCVLRSGRDDIVITRIESNQGKAVARSGESVKTAFETGREG